MAESGQDELRGELLQLEVVSRTGRCGKGNRERQQSNESNATLRIHRFIVVSAGQRKCQSKARSSLRKSLPRGETNTPKGCSNHILSVRQAATSPKSPDTQGPFLSTDVSLFLLEAFTPQSASVTPLHGPALPLWVLKMSAPTQAQGWHPAAC